MSVPLLVALTGCALGPISPPSVVKPSNVNADAVLTPATRITRDLVKLPAPLFKVPVAVYAFRDQTGQFRGQPESNLSNAVTQGAAAILVKSLLDSGWYLPTEREGFQNLLNERRVARAIEVPADRGKPGSSFPNLIPAQFIMEGGIVGFETNVRTGGEGANLLGVGAETKYSINQVTVNLRSVDVRTGQVVNSVSVTKTLFSHEISSSVYKYISYKTLLQAEGGYSTNEPSQLAVKEAIETAVIHLTLQGIASRVWSLKNEQDWYLPTVQNYMREAELQLADPESPPSGQNTTVSMRDPTLIRPPQLPLHLQAAAVEQPTLPPVPPAAPAVTGRAAPVTPRFAAVAPAAPAVPAAQAATTAVSAPASPSAPKPQPMIPAAVPQVPVSSVEAPSRPAVQVDMDTSPSPSAPAPAALVSKAPEGPEPLLQAAQPPKGAAPTGQAKAAPTVPPMPATRPRFAPLHTTIPELDDDSNLGFFVISAL